MFTLDFMMIFNFIFAIFLALIFIYKFFGKKMVLMFLTVIIAVVIVRVPVSVLKYLISEHFVNIILTILFLMIISISYFMFYRKINKK